MTLGATYLFGRIPHICRVIGCLLALIAERQVAQLVARVKHMIAHRKVDDGGEDAAHPDREVVRVDAEYIPL